MIDPMNDPIGVFFWFFGISIALFVGFWVAGSWRGGSDE